MKASWALHEAKARFSELVDEAVEHGPQAVTRHGERVVVVLAAKEFDRLHGKGRSLLQALRSCPAKGELDLDNLRRRSEGIRDLDLGQ